MKIFSTRLNFFLLISYSIWILYLYFLYLGSNFIKAMGFGVQSSHVVRISFGWENTEDDISALADAIIALYKRFKEK